MSQKRPRAPTPTSIQSQNATAVPDASAPPVSAAGTVGERENKVSTAWQFDDFRRRHSKQNKEIIKMNFELKIALAAVQKELATLRLEIIETRMRNSALSRELRVRGSGHSGRADQVQAQRQAVETILAAVPALQQLLSSTLNISPSNNQSIPGARSAEKAPASADMPLVFTVRPAASAAKEQTLGTLVEGSECGSELDVGDVEERMRVKTIHRPRISGLASRSNRSVSPPPLGLHQPISPLLPARPPSPVSSPSSSPHNTRTVARASPRARKGRGDQVKRRRESGLVKPLSPALLEEDVQASGPGEGDSRAESAIIGAANEEEARIEDEEAVLDLIDGTGIAEGAEGDLGDTLSIEANTTGKSKGRSRATNTPATATAGPSAELGPESTTTLLTHEPNGQPVLNIAEEFLQDDPEGGIGRGRRSRNSVVSYKEPSLNKKMRKPDGTTVEDALKGSSRASLAAGTEPSMTITEPSSSSSSSSKSSRSTFDTAQALRRKSSLPRAGRKATLKDEEQLSDSDGDGYNDPPVVTGVSREDSLSPPPPLDFRVAQTEHSVSKKSGRVDDPVSVSSSSSSRLVFRPGSQAATARNSPRKSPKKQHGGPSYARPSSSSTNKRLNLAVQVGRGRDPLADRLENGPIGRRGGAVGVGAVREIGKTLNGGAAARV